ncbi:hypothetical protein AD933_07770 [Acetobacter malorum]|uniref:Integrase n=1 Tax=Acetobacter malorum TaxID=178901 RepID=A0A149RP19_9PROT|nr:DUF6538 domain-containing protein [Acetobacter malorum]KXV15985.1 hypothetical protein AD933_07770 [Acetobacter malorum]
MRNMIKRGNSYSVRFNVPEDRVQDVGRVFGAKNGRKTEIVRTLQTRDYREALKRRDVALAAIRATVDAKLLEEGLAPLSEDFTPDWWASPVKAVEAGHHYRQQIEQTSDDYDPAEGLKPGEAVEGAPESEREHVRSVVTDLVLETSEKLPPAEGKRYFDTVMGVVEGTATPMGPLADRWLDVQRRLRLTNGLISRHKRVLGVFGEYLLSASGAGEGKSEDAFRAYPMQKVDKRLARRFREWLEESGKGANTVNSYLSSLRTFWTWLVDAGEAESNPWAGMSGGLKRLARREIEDGNEKRPFTEAELLALLSGEPNSRDPRMVQTIHDVFRLALLTGARQNELCSLTVGRVEVPKPAESGSDNPEELWGIAVTRDVAKTDNSVRTIPLHPLVRPIIERRLRLAGSGGADALLFPELRPGGEDGKMGWGFSKHFQRYRKAVLGNDNKGTDFHSTRRCFATFMETALAHGATACTATVHDRLIGHTSSRLAANTYAAKQFEWSLYSDAILGMVDKGVPERVREALSAIS